MGTAEWMEDDIERILKEVLKDFKVRFVPLLLLYLMIVATADSMCTAFPIFLISQPASLLTFPTLHRMAGMEPTPFSPFDLTPSLHNIQHKVSSGTECSLLPVLLLQHP